MGPAVRWRPPGNRSLCKARMAVPSFPLPVDTAPMEAKLGETIPTTADLGSMSPNGTASVASPSRQVASSTSAPNPASRLDATFPN